jgi:predicted fused transcriptional regulator/phosphomethylpyrimidine kinase
VRCLTFTIAKGNLIVWANVNLHYPIKNGNDWDETMLAEPLNKSVINDSYRQRKCNQGGQPPSGGKGMQERVKRLEDQVTTLVSNVAVIKSNYATKEDVAAVKADVAVIKSNYATKEDVAAVKADVAIIKSNYATKEDVAAIKVDLSKAIITQTKWMVTTQFVTLGAGLSLAKLLF